MLNVSFDVWKVSSPKAILIPFFPINIMLGPEVGFPLVSPRTMT
jgi:hypothetical protein